MAEDIAAKTLPAEALMLNTSHEANETGLNNDAGNGYEHTA